MPQHSASTRARTTSRGRNGSGSGAAISAGGRQTAGKTGATTTKRDSTAPPVLQRTRSGGAAVDEVEPPRSILVRRNSEDAAESESVGGEEASCSGKNEGSYSKETVDNDNDDDGSIITPLLKFLPRHIDPSTIRKLLGAVHPSAFGAYRTKEAWRKENPDVLYSAYSSRSTAARGESCPPVPSSSSTSSEQCLAHSPPSSISVDDCEYGWEGQVDREQLDWERESYSSSPTGSVSSLAELANTSGETERLQPPSKLAIYLSRPSEEQSSSSPTSGQALPRRIQRQHSTSSFGTSSSVCTCTSNASNVSKSSSIRFATLPDTEELRKHKGRKNERSFTMGIAGRKNLLLGKTSPDVEEDDDTSSPVDEPTFSFDDDIPGGDSAGNDLEDDYEAYQKANASDITIRYNEEGEMVEKRPLGVTLEDLNLPMKRTRHTRGRPRNTSDLSTSFSPTLLTRALSSPPSLASTLPSSSSAPITAETPSTATTPSSKPNDLPTSHQSPSSSSHGRHSKHSSNESSSSSSSFPHNDEKTPMQTPRFEKLELEFTSIATPRSGSPVKQLRVLEISPIMAATSSVASTPKATLQPAVSPSTSNARELEEERLRKAGIPEHEAEEDEEDESPDLDHDLVESSSPSGSSPESPSSDSSDFEDEDKNFFSSDNDDEDGANEGDETFDGDQTIGSISRDSAVRSKGGKSRKGLAIPSLLTGVCSGKQNGNGGIKVKLVKRGTVKARPLSGKSSYSAFKSKKTT